MSFVPTRDDLLRLPNPYHDDLNRPVFNGVHLDRAVIEYLMLSSDPIISLQMTIMSDSLRHIPRDTRCVSFDDLKYNTSKCQYNMASHHHHIQNLSYFTHINNTNHSMEYILSKVLPQGCQGRTTGTVIRDLLELLMKKEIKHPTQKSGKLPCPNRMKVMSKVKELVLVSLLGNYLHVTPSSRPVGAVRTRIIKLCNSTDWILNMLTHTEQMVSYCIRDYLVYAIQDDPALYRFMKPYMNFDKFKETTCKYMDEMRRYLSVYMQFPSTSMSQAVDEPDHSIVQPYHNDIELLFSESKSDTLRAKYHRPNPPFTDFILDRKKKYPPDLTLLTQEHLDALHHVVQCTTKSTFFAALVVLLPSFGITDPAILNALRVLLQLYEWSSVSILRLQTFVEGQKEIRDKKLNKVKKPALPGMYQMHPFLYTVLQTGCMIWSEHYRMETLAVLPVHYIVNQVDAAQSSLGLSHTNYMFDSNLYLLYCDVCDEIYSLLREVEPNDASHIKDKKTEEATLNLMCGFKDVVIDYRTGRKYCLYWNTAGKSRTMPDGSVRKCGDQPLVYKCLLGNVVRDNETNQYITLCPQDNCCVPMALHTDCAYTERGICCSDCTKAIEQTPLYYDQLMQRYHDMINKPVKCDVCFNVIDSKKKMYLYPYDLVLCRKHNSNRMIRNVKELIVDKQSNYCEIQCIECDALYKQTKTYQLCSHHYNQWRVNECKHCARLSEFTKRPVLCDEHANGLQLFETNTQLNRCIVLCLMHQLFKSLQTEKKERLSMNKDKFNRQRMRAKQNTANNVRR